MNVNSYPGCYWLPWLWAVTIIVSGNCGFEWLPWLRVVCHNSWSPRYYDLLTRNDDKELRQEFVTFDSFDDNNTCYHGSIPENDSKNRYKNIIPCESHKCCEIWRYNPPGQKTRSIIATFNMLFTTKPLQLIILEWNCRLSVMTCTQTTWTPATSTVTTSPGSS